jgi:hypothetical protein
MTGWNPSVTFTDFSCKTIAISDVYAALATVINLINPLKLAFGGGTISLPDYFDAVKEVADKYSISEARDACVIYKVHDVMSDDDNLIEWIYFGSNNFTI